MNDLSEVKYRIEEEGLDYCFRCYSNFDEIEDTEFHKLRERYIAASKALEKYVNENSNKDE
jgi:hypothetical protein